MHADLICTCRLQLSPAFGFREAADRLPYLSEIGVSHVYLSPVLQAADGSEHGYDVTDPTRISEALGGEEGLAALFEGLRQHRMGAVLDVVPNHQAAGNGNPWWMDVLEKGQASPFAEFYDINWNPPDCELRGKLLLPVLGDHLGKVFERGELKILPEAACLAYFDHRFPINAEGLAMLDENPENLDINVLLEKQHYRLVRWQNASDEVNYRRFFDVATLIGVRMEDPRVFEESHAAIFHLLETGVVDGLRIDHPDGLRDPAEYFSRLRESAGKDCWIVAEKILEPNEALPSDWEVDGTTGYDFLQRVGGLFIDDAGEKAISDFYTDFTGQSEPYGLLVREKKRRILEWGFDGDIRRMVELLKTISLQAPFRLDFPRRVLRELIVELLAGFPVYRTYVRPGQAPGEADAGYIAEALAATRRREPPFEDELLEMMEKLLRGEVDDSPLAADFLLRFQQLTGPVMAKGVEDTTFYCYDRLLALNDVGCDPARFGVSPQAFHEACSVAHKEWPQGMLTTSTHDTKRSEDVRARISLLSEIPLKWAEQVRLWSQHNLPAWKGRFPDRNAEHLLYQTLVGAWPIETERITSYMHKACREAKRHTSWLRPDDSYEERIREFAECVLADAEFVSMLEDFVTPMVFPGRINSLSQTLIKLTAPGIPDIYQGCELWDNSLVDPDNRRPVDFALREGLLKEIANGIDVAELLERADEGLPKLHLIRQALALRRNKPQSFAPGPLGAYRPLLVSGSRLRHLVAYTRGGDVAVLAPRLVIGLDGDWEDTVVDLGPGEWRNVLDGSRHSGTRAVCELLGRFPVALLTKI